MNMKITPEHYARLESAITATMSTTPLDSTRSSMFNRWNIWNKACDNDNYSLARELYTYLTDDNIDAALKKITNIK